MSQIGIVAYERDGGWICLKFGFDGCNNGSCGWLGLLRTCAILVTQIGCLMIIQRKFMRLFKGNFYGW